MYHTLTSKYRTIVLVFLVHLLYGCFSKKDTILCFTPSLFLKIKSVNCLHISVYDKNVYNKIKKDFEYDADYTVLFSEEIATYDSISLYEIHKISKIISNGEQIDSINFYKPNHLFEISYDIENNVNIYLYIETDSKGHLQRCKIKGKETSCCRSSA